MSIDRGVGIAVLLASLLAQPAWADKRPAKPSEDDPSWGLCQTAAAEVEAEFGIPDHLLAAVTLTETGRNGPDRKMASWPWTVHDGTRGYHLASKEEAVELVRQLRAGGRRSVDVGCMQVNLKHHPRAFTSVEEGFDPVSNLRYAATFLKRLKDVHGTWEGAVARYHSYNPTYYENYANKVLAYWEREKVRAAQARSTDNDEIKTADALTPRVAPGRESDEIEVALLGTEPANGPEKDVAPSDKPELAASDESGLTFFRTFGWPR